ncbi:unnamed protein product [Schistosoma mattheei]|uniref:Uncharacterized protein n=1 Tax=Schistosoma mattheei TaxID=31246 RepID=A0A183PSS7_9TREM|nr:unnamed protein product [Schistosoma mattheei]
MVVSNFLIDSRLISSHQRLSKLNHELEERLLDTIEKSSTEIHQLTEELESTKNSLRTAQQTLNSIVEERDRCKEDCISAVKLLQANPNQFISELPPVVSETVTFISRGYVIGNDKLTYGFL